MFHRGGIPVYSKAQSPQVWTQRGVLKETWQIFQRTFAGRIAWGTEQEMAGAATSHQYVRRVQQQAAGGWWVQAAPSFARSNANVTLITQCGVWWQASDLSSCFRAQLHEDMLQQVTRRAWVPGIMTGPYSAGHHSAGHLEALPGTASWLSFPKDSSPTQLACSLLHVKEAQQPEKQLSRATSEAKEPQVNWTVSGWAVKFSPEERAEKLSQMIISAGCHYFQAPLLWTGTRNSSMSFRDEETTRVWTHIALMHQANSAVQTRLEFLKQSNIWNCAQRFLETKGQSFSLDSYGIDNGYLNGIWHSFWILAGIQRFYQKATKGVVPYRPRKGHSTSLCSPS